METSPSIAALAEALSKAQGEITGALKDSANPFYRSKYADLASCLDACRGPLSKNGLAISQGASATDSTVSVTTMLMHTSGEWVRDTLTMTPKKPDPDKDTGEVGPVTPQAVGSCITYARRYAYAAIVGLAQVDDDAETAQGRIRVDPAEEQVNLSAQQTRYAAEFAGLMRDILASAEERPADALNLHRQMNEDQAVYVAASKLLSAPQRKAWKELVKQGVTADAIR